MYEEPIFYNVLHYNITKRILNEITTIMDYDQANQLIRIKSRNSKSQPLETIVCNYDKAGRFIGRKSGTETINYQYGYLDWSSPTLRLGSHGDSSAGNPLRYIHGLTTVVFEQRADKILSLTKTDAKGAKTEVDPKT